MSNDHKAKDGSAPHMPGPCEGAYQRGMPVAVSVEELAALTRQAVAPKFVSADFGVHGLQLWAHERCGWAYQALDELRTKATGTTS